MAIWAIVEDLVFRSKIETVAGALGLPVHITASAVPPPLVKEGGWQAIIIDLNRSSDDPLEVVRVARQQAPSARIIGYGSHVDTDLLSAATQAGCTMVLPRSVFVQRLPDLLLGK